MSAFSAMNDPVRKVEIVRPKHRWEDAFGTFVGKLADLAFSAWLVILLVPLFSALRPDYWQAVAFILAVRTVLPANTGYLNWTRAARETRKR